MPEEAPRYIAEPKAKSALFSQVLGLMVWPSLVIALVVGVLFVDRMRKLKEETIQQQAFLLHSAREMLHDQFDTVVADLSLLVNSGRFNEPSLELNLSEEYALATLFENLLIQRPEYRQVQFFDIYGQELIHAFHHKNSSSVRVETSREEHINGKNAPYDLGDILSQPHGTIYVSPLEPDTSRTSADKPPIPVMRFATVVKKEEKLSSGVIIISYRAAGLLEALSQITSQTSGHLFLINAQGNYLINPDDNELPTKETNTQKKNATAFRDKFPEIWEEIEKNRNGYRLKNGGLYSFSEVRPFSEKFLLSLHSVNGAPSQKAGSSIDPPYWYIVSEYPAVYFTEKRTDYGAFLIILGAVLMIPTLAVCTFLAKTRNKVRQEVNFRYQDQARHLAELENKVNLRTRELDESNQKLSTEVLERLNTAEQLKQSNELLSSMLESIDGIIYVADFDSHEILYANQYLINLFGFDPVGRHCWQYIHSSKDGPCEFCSNDHLLDQNGKPAQPYQWEYQNPFNKKWYAAKDQAVMWSTGKYVRLEIATDITEQKQLQHFLQEARRQADLAAGIRSRFVALVAHDLKSPFFSIIQMIRRILERETFSHRAHQQFLENIVENGHRMLQMIDDLLSMDRFEKAEVKLDRSFFDVSEMADEVLQNFSHLAFEKGIRIINYIPAGSMLYADKYLYFVVLNNLVSNAVKFNEKGGEIEVLIPEADRPMMIAVRDNGKGMSQDYLQNLFKADVKTSSRGTSGEKGSGLGLIFCQDILNAHHGTIHVESERDSGTTFYIELPECSDARIRPDIGESKDLPGNNNF
jgi:signal transduction histidine kinase